MGCRRQSRILSIRSDEMRDFGRLSQMEAVHALLHQAIGVCDPLVLAQMLRPRCDQEGLDDAPFIGSILEHVPAIGAIAATLMSELLEDP